MVNSWAKQNQAIREIMARNVENDKAVKFVETCQKAYTEMTGEEPPLSETRKYIKSASLAGADANYLESAFDMKLPKDRY